VEFALYDNAFDFITPIFQNSLKIFTALYEFFTQSILSKTRENVIKLDNSLASGAEAYVMFLLTRMNSKQKFQKCATAPTN